MALCGVNRIDDMLGGSTQVLPLATGDNDVAAVGAVQDFLACQGYRGMPGPLSSAWGRYGPQTTQAVREFQRDCGLPVSGQVDQSTLRALVERPAPAAMATRGYLALVLDIEYQGITRLMSLTSQFEGAGRFGAVNLNSDRAGLSFGLIQWAQKPGRLNELLRAFSGFAPHEFVRILGGGDADLALRLIQHTAKPRGGTDSLGVTTDPQFDLVVEPWLGRFRAAAQDGTLQKVQVHTATADFASSLAQLRAFAPELTTEREIAFMLDLANQHGDAGARSIRDTVGAKLIDLAGESQRRVAAQFGANSNEVASTRARRTAFRTSTLLRDAPFGSQVRERS